MLAKVPTKSLWLSSCFSFASQRHSSVISSQKKLINPKDSSVFWLRVCANSSKKLIKRASAYKILYWNPNLSVDLQSQTTISFFITMMISLNIQKDKLVSCSDLEKTILVSFPSKSLNYTATKNILTEIVILNRRKLHHLYRSRYWIANKGELIGSNYDVVAHSPLIVGIILALLFSLGTCFVQIQSVWVNFACTEVLFNLSAEAIVIHCPQCVLCARCAMFLFEDQTHCCFLTLGQGVYTFEESRK